MPEVHLSSLNEPKEERPAAPVAQPHVRGRSLPKLLLEVALIAAGVFLGLAGEQWRENAEHRNDARVVLERFRAEIAANRQGLARVKDYHVSMRASLKSYLASNAKERAAFSLKIEGVQVAHFERTVWNLALSTGSLAHIDQDIAFGLSRIYSAQEMHAGLSQGLAHAMYIRPPGENFDGFLAAMAVYFDDMVIIEPNLLNMYEEILPALDRALGGTNDR